MGGEHLGFAWSHIAIILEDWVCVGPTLGCLWFVLKLFRAVLGLFSAVLGLFPALDLGLSWSWSWSWAVWSWAVLGCLDLTWAFLALF